MQNNGHFEELIPVILRSIPYILQSHVFKAYCALENLYAEKPHWSQQTWEYCTEIIRTDEPKVEGIIAPKLMEIDEIVDPTSGRDFGPDWILGRGLMPLSYWAMHKKYEELGFADLFQQYLNKALDHPKYLGHEISVLAGNWQFYNDVLSSEEPSERMQLFLQRFTEFAVTTFDSGNDTVFDHPPIDATPSETEILHEALSNPGFFGHNVLAFVWSQRIKSIMDEGQYKASLYNLTVMNRWHSFGEAPKQVNPLDKDWTESILDERFERYFADGPTNIHQITLADALLWVWNHHPEHRRLCAANILCFTNGVSPN